MILFQLGNTKGHDGRTTLIHYLVDTIEKKFPDITGFTEELLHIEKAARGNQD